VDTKGNIVTLPKGTEKMVPLLPQEEKLLANVPQEERLNTLINLRFRAWLDYNNIKVTTLTKLKLKQAYAAGFHSAQGKK